MLYFSVLWSQKGSHWYLTMRTDWHLQSKINSAMDLFLSIQICHFLDCYLRQYECQMKVEVCKLWKKNLKYDIWDSAVRAYCLCFFKHRADLLSLCVWVSLSPVMVCSVSLLWLKWSWEFFDAVWKMDVECQCLLLILNSGNNPSQLKGR